LDPINSTIIGVSALFGLAAVVLGVRVVRRALRRDACIRCGYPTQSMQVCPECGTASVSSRLRRVWRLKWRFMPAGAVAFLAALGAMTEALSLRHVKQMPGWVLVRVAPLDPSRGASALERRLGFELDRRVRARALSPSDDAELLFKRVKQLVREEPLVVIPDVWNKPGAVEISIRRVRLVGCQGWGRIDIMSPEGGRLDRAGRVCETSHPAARPTTATPGVDLDAH